VGERESTWGVRTREPDDLVLQLIECEGMTVVDVGEKLIVRLLVAGNFGEVEAHESDLSEASGHQKGVDVLDGQGLHVCHNVAELRNRGVDGSDVVKSRSLGVILETKTRLQATSKELVRNRCTGDGVQKENFRPRRCTTIRRVDPDFRKHFVEGCERFCLFLEEPPKPVLEHGVRGFAVAGEPRFAHRAMQFLLIGCLVPRREAPPSVATPTVLSASVISSSSVSWRRRAMVSVPA
jgi:hypothetical protein